MRRALRYRAVVIDLCRCLIVLPLIVPIAYGQSGSSLLSADQSSTQLSEEFDSILVTDEENKLADYFTTLKDPLALKEVPVTAKEVLPLSGQAPFVGAIKGLPVPIQTLHHSGIQRVEALTTIDANSLDVLYPGAIFDSEFLARGEFVPVAVRRRPGRIVMTNVSPNTETARAATSGERLISATVHPGSLSSVNEELQKLVLRCEAAPAQVAMTMHDYTSYEEALFKMGVSASFLGIAGGSAKFDSNLIRTSNNIAVQLMQPYYTVAYEYPFHGARFFVPEDVKSTPARIKAAFSASTPVYVASVTYGRMLLFFVNSGTSLAETKAAVAAGFNVGLFGASTTIDTKHLETLRRCDIKVVALGGSGEAIAGLLGEDKLKAVAEYIKQGQSFSAKSPGYPLAATFRYVLDGRIAQVPVAVSYETSQLMELPIKRIIVRMFTEDEAKSGSETVTASLYWNSFLLKETESVRRKPIDPAIATSLPPIFYAAISSDEWGKYSPPVPWEYDIPLEMAQQLKLKDAESLKVGVAKTGEDKWHFTLAVLAVVEKNGQEVTVEIIPRSSTTVTRFGKDNGKSFEWFPPK